MKELEGRVRLIIQTSMKKGSGFEERLVPDYPEWALRELLMNAVMHRNCDSNTPIRFYVFADFVEIQSPGGLYGEATPENFPMRNSYRNPIIAEAMKSLVLCCENPDTDQPIKPRVASRYRSSETAWPACR
nr:ATP-binding protein [Lamprobacter modestohalophilus]